MPIATINGIPLNYQVKGSGDLVVLIMGTGSPGRVWDLHQVPALVKEGYRVATFDNRGIAPSGESLGGITIEDMVKDTAGLIELLGGPAHIVGTSMGSRVAQELALARPDLVRKAVFLAAHARMDRFQITLTEGERQLYDSGVELPREVQGRAHRGDEPVACVARRREHCPRLARCVRIQRGSRSRPVCGLSWAWTASSIAVPPTGRCGCRACRSGSPTIG